MGLARGSLLLLALGSLQLLAVYGQDVPNNPCNAFSCANGGTCVSSGFPRFKANCTCPSLFAGLQCKVRLCPDPGNVNISTRVPQMNPAVPTFQPGDNISYSCNIGYNLVGSSVLTCNASVWSAALPQCTVVTCFYPNIPLGGSLTYSSQPLEYNSIVTASCDTGFYLQGTAARRCMANGRLSGYPPFCTEIRCPYPAVPSGGSLSPAPFNGSLSFNTTVTATCGPGFTLSGSATRRCMHNTRMSGTPSVCTANVCPTLNAPSHGSLSVSPSGATTYNATATAACDSGYTLTSGSGVRRCSSTGAWTGTPAVCSDFCQSASCPHDSGTQNTTWTDCCRYAGRSVQCCQPGVQNIVKDRYRNITNPTCKNALSTTRLFGPCIGSLFTCLSLQLNQRRSRCADIHGCAQYRGNTSQCHGLFGLDAMLCKSTVYETGTPLTTHFCLPASCHGSLDDVAASDYIMNCDILTTLGSWDKCPLRKVKISCPGGNGTFDVGGSNPPKPTDSGIKPGILALIIILVLLGILLLAGVMVFIYRKGQKPTDGIDFARLQNDDDDDDDGDDA